MKINKSNFTEYDFIDEFLRERFFKYVVIKENDCHLWIGCIKKSPNKKTKGNTSYGQFRFKRKNIFAHRMAYLLEHGCIPENLIIMHTCDNPTCVNPNHLIASSHSENAKDCILKGRANREIGKNKSKGSVGIKNGRTKLTEDDILLIRRLKTSNLKQTEIAEIFNVSKQLISRIQSNGSWTHI